MPGRGGLIRERGLATLGRLALVLIWGSAGGLALQLPAAAGVALLLGVALAFLFVHVWLPWRVGNLRKLAALHLRPLAPGVWPWLWLAVPVTLLAKGGFLLLHLPFMGPLPGDPAWAQRLAEMPGGWLIGLILVLVSAPLIEEFAFRGWILFYWKRLVGRYGGLLLSAILFAALHGLLFTLPLHTLHGLFYGAAVLATRSVWAGVFLHAAHNATTVLMAPLLLLQEDPVPGLLLLGLAAFLLGGQAFLHILRRLRELSSASTRQHRYRPGHHHCVEGRAR